MIASSPRGSFMHKQLVVQLVMLDQVALLYTPGWTGF